MVKQFVPHSIGNISKANNGRSGGTELSNLYILTHLILQQAFTVVTFFIPTLQMQKLTCSNLTQK